MCLVLPLCTRQLLKVLLLLHSFLRSPWVLLKVAPWFARDISLSWVKEHTFSHFPENAGYTSLSIKHLVALDDRVQMHQRSLAADKNLMHGEKTGARRFPAWCRARHTMRAAYHAPVSLPLPHSGSARASTAPPSTPGIAQAARSAWW